MALSPSQLNAATAGGGREGYRPFHYWVITTCLSDSVPQRKISIYVIVFGAVHVADRRIAASYELVWFRTSRDSEMDFSITALRLLRWVFAWLPGRV